jgi:RHS repeat-associated protein
VIVFARALAAIATLLLVCAAARAQGVIATTPDGQPIAFITPLGIDGPTDGRAAASAFRVVAHLPADVDRALASAGSELRFAIMCEVAPQTPPDFPQSALRLVLRNVLPEPVRAANRHQGGANQFRSPIIVAIADPRASIRYAWPAGADKRAEGCFNCERLPALRGLTEADGVYELFTSGAAVVVHPDGNVFGNTPYAHLGENGRLELRVPTVNADTIRAPAIRVAANAPPLAGGLLQESTYLHSGELETSSVDLDAGGRAGWNVVAARTYRSRTIGFSALGFGWDSTLFRRLRTLPNFDVEYRDGEGEVWLFQGRGDGTFTSPTGLFLRLSRTADGFTLVDQKSRVTSFDARGRMLSEADEFFDPTRPGSGNVIRYLYDENGRLFAIVDPLGRRTTLTWDNATGLAESIADWHTPARTIRYEYDARWRLTRVHLPEVAGRTPRIEYTYDGDSPRLATIKDPKEALSGGAARVTFTYANERVTRQQWGTGETATFAYDSPTSVTVKDVLGQERRYTLTANDTANLLADRAHIAEVREAAVAVWNGAAFGQLPPSVAASAPATSASERVNAFTFEHGVLKSARLDGVRETSFGYQSATGGVGLLVTSTTTTPLVVTAALSDHSAAAPLVPASSPITHTFIYQPGSNFLAATETGGKRIESMEASRANLTPTETNSSIASTQTFASNGLLNDVTASGGTDPASAGAKSHIEYWPDTAPLHARGLPHVIREGDGEDVLVTKIDYPSETRTVSTDPRGVVTTTDVDTWDRPVRVRVERPGDPLVIEQTFTYDATGRLEQTTEKQGTEIITTTHTFDVMGRRTSTTITGIATVGSVTTSTAYNLAARTITTTHEGGAVTTSELDSLGRVTRRVTETGSSPIEERYAYDLAGNQVFATDLLSASASAYDAHGRAVATRAADGTLATTAYDEWSRPTTVKTLTDDASATVAESSFAYTPAGRLTSTTTKVDAGLERTTAFAWDGGGRTTRTATNGRASAAAFDLAGRMTTHAAGAGNLAALTEIFEKAEVIAHDGALPASTKSLEKNGAAYTTTTDRNAAGDVVRENVGPLEWKRAYDELGNVTEASVPGRPPTHWKIDARGAVEKETLPDGAENNFAYHPSGAQSAYTDPASEATSTATDLLGRPLTRTYADGTTERIEWEGARIKSVTDRQNRKQAYVYNAKGQLTDIRDGANTLVDRLAYDNAGRLVAWTNAGSEITWSAFDLDGNPKRTTQKRFRDSSGLAATPIVLDELMQEHRWNEHGERVRFSMPFAAEPGAGWSKWIAQSFDAVGNLTNIARLDSETATTATPVMTASYRGAERPDVRTVFTAGAPIVRTYAYDTTTSLLSRLDVTVNSVSVAGSEVAYDGLQKSAARLLGLSSGQRYARYAYDDRSRLAASVYGTRQLAPPIVPLPGRAREYLNPADFRNAQERTPQLDALQSNGIDTSKIDPPTTTFDEQPGGGHKIARLTQGPLVFPFGYDGSERIDDGRFLYTFDAKGRLIRATEKATVPPIRRAVYAYTGTGRLIGRRAEYSTAAGEWKLEDRPQILAADGLPADTTFAWDPISDRLLALYPAGAAADPIKQIFHGQSAYDDPLETTTRDPLTGAITHLYPIYDEAAAGSLQAVLNTRAELVARNLTNDPYGAADLALLGAAIDAVTIKATKNATGAIERVEVTLHATEQLDPTTLAAGTRLAAVDKSGAIVRTATPIATLAANDPFTIRWTLTAADWNALTDSTPSATRTPASLSIAATNNLRAIAWSSTIPVMPAPEWARATRPIYTSPDLPIEVRESLSSLSSYLASLASNEQRATTLYAVETLGLLGVTDANTPLEQIASARMHAHPFTDPLTQLDYVRARWYDARTGSFLTPDPFGYNDSSNLYAFAGGDPVNGRDPSGSCWVKKAEELMEQIRSTEVTALKLAQEGTDYGFAIRRKREQLRELLGNQDRDPCTTDDLVSIEPSQLMTRLSMIVDAYESTPERAQQAAEEFWRYEPRHVDPQLAAEGGDYRAEMGQRLSRTTGHVAGAIALGTVVIGQFAIEGEVGDALIGEFVASVKKIVRRGGRWGNAATRQQLVEIAMELEAHGWRVEYGGGEWSAARREEYLRPIGGGRQGGSYPDITATKNGRTLRINTVDTYADSVTPTAREARNAARIRKQQKPGEHLLLVPKKK